MRSSISFLAWMCIGVAAGCGPSGRGFTGGGDNPDLAGVVNPGECPQGCTSCDAQKNCHDCVAGQDTCAGTSVASCNADGTIGMVTKPCDTMNNETCHLGQCLSACDVAAQTHSYIGCDYWPVTTLTSQLNPYFDFAVAVANPVAVGDVVMSPPAQITITRGGKMIATETVDAGAVKTIMLPWVQELSQQPNCAGGVCMPTMEKSVLVTAGAYHLVSTVPVTVYQFSPLQFEKQKSPTCDDQRGCLTDKDCLNGDKCDPFLQQCNTTMCHSFSNDASILLPSTTLQNDYIVAARGTFALSQSVGGQSFTAPLPGFTAVVATVDNTKVTIKSTSNVEPGTGVKSLSAGQTATYSLMQGDVLQLVSQRSTSPCANSSSEMNNGVMNTYCDLGPKFDFTGSHVTSDKPVAVFGGHACTFVPYNKWACDHIEEQMTPLMTWGQKVLVAQTKPQTHGEPNVWRVISGGDKNMVVFDPPSTHPSTTLNTGEYVEFVAQGGFEVIGTGRLAVAQYPVGENYLANSNITVGDPDLGLGVPIEEYRNSYDFLSPSSYTQNNLTVIAPKGTQITLDMVPVNSNFTPIGGSGYGYAYVSLMPGPHHVSADQAFGITVSGVASFTSYLFVGGQNLSDVILQ